MLSYKRGSDLTYISFYTDEKLIEFQGIVENTAQKNLGFTKQR